MAPSPSTNPFVSDIAWHYQRATRCPRGTPRGRRDHCTFPAPPIQALNLLGYRARTVGLVNIGRCAIKRRAFQCWEADEA